MFIEEAEGEHKVVTRTVHVQQYDVFLLIQEFYYKGARESDVLITLSRNDIKALAETEQSTPKGYTGTDG